MFKKNRKDIQKPVLRNCMYIIVPVLAILAFKFIGVGASWLFDVVTKAGWPVLITFVVTSLFWAIFYGVREQRKPKVNVGGDEAMEDVEEDYEV